MKKILLADNHQHTMLLAKLKFKSLFPGAKIFQAENGLKALEIMNQNLGFDIIFLNPNLPYVSGLDVAKIYRHKFTERACVIANDRDMLRFDEMHEFFDVIMPQPWQDFNQTIMEAVNK